MNVVFVCIDCLRNDFVQSEYADTPFIDKLATEGIYFNNMFSTTTTTTPSVASFMTGCYSEKNGVNTHSHNELNEKIDTLAEVFKNNNYGTYAMVTGPLVKDTGLDRGFDKYWYRDRNDSLFTGWKKKAADRVSSMEEPFFFYLHLWELHWPITTSDNFKSKKYGNSSYAKAFSALDRQLELFVESLPEDTVLLLHGDHGESITGRGIPWNVPRYLYRKFVDERVTNPKEYDTRKIKRITNRLVEHITRPKIKDHYLETGHGDNVFDFTTNVPFIINAPSLEASTVDTQVRQIDVYPTILDICNLESSTEQDIDGKSLLPPENLDDRDAYIRACGGPKKDGHGNSWMRSVRSDGYKYIEYPNRDWSPELYELSSDSRELYPTHNEALEKEMADRLPDEELRDVGRIEIDELLKDLGYLQ